VVVIQKIGAFFRLVRYPNLIFIALTQSLFYFSILLPTYQSTESGTPLMGYTDFFLLLFSSVCIAAAGYIINDYFDMDIDHINKPQKMVIGKWIGRRWAMLWHMLLSLIGLFLTAIVALHVNNMLLLVFNFASVVVLLFYSTTFKKKLLIGNVLISLLTAWVIGVLFVAEINLADLSYLKRHKTELDKLYKYTLVYAGFAFIVSLIREVVKDLEDMIGDKKFGCTTMPIIWGVNVSKIFIAIWLVVLMGLLLAILIYAIIHNWFWLQLLLIVSLLFYLIFILFNVKKANGIADYSMISKHIKLVMLVGILSIFLFL
jgi:4-hydroxybenzoate polyprenyltransferase